MSRRLRAVVSVALVAALSVAVSGCTGSGDKKQSTSKSPDKVTYLTAFGAVGRDAFAWVAQDKGYFKEAGLDVEPIKFAGAQQVMEAMLSGRSDGSSNGTGSANLAIGEIALRSS